MTEADVEILVSIFARYHPTGWQIPVWLAELAHRLGVENGMPTFYVIDWSR